MKVFIREDLYSPEEIADLLLLSVGGNRLRARTILVHRPKRPKPRTSDSTAYWAAYEYQQKLREKGRPCSDFTAIKKVWGGRDRTLWKQLEARHLTLEQVALSFGENGPPKY